MFLLNFWNMPKHIFIIKLHRYLEPIKSYSTNQRNVILVFISQWDYLLENKVHMILMKTNNLVRSYYIFHTKIFHNNVHIILVM